MREITSGLMPALILGACLACGPSTSDEGATEPAPTAAVPASGAVPASLPAGSATPREEAREIFATRCTPCHGPSGRGDGPASAGLTPPPRNFNDPAWQQSVSDSHIEQIIQYGGAAVGRSPAMPSNPDLMGKPAVVTALREHLRELAQP